MTTYNYSLTGQDAFEMDRGFWEAISEVKFRDAPNGTINNVLYDSTVTGRGETAKDAVMDLIVKLQQMGLTDNLKRYQS